MTERSKYWRQIIAEWSRSGLNQAEFCRRRDIQVGTFRWWKRRLSTAPSSRPHSSGRPRKRPRGPRNSFVEVRLADTLSRMGYEVVLSGGRVLRLPPTFDPETLTRLIRAVEAACSPCHHRYASLFIGVRRTCAGASTAWPSWSGRSLGRIRSRAICSFSSSHSRDGPLNVLGHYSGYIQADAHSSYNALFEPTGNGRESPRIEVGCWAHARRKFYDARLDDRRRCTEMLALIGRLYDVEREAKAAALICGMSLPARAIPNSTITPI